MRNRSNSGESTGRPGGRATTPRLGRTIAVASAMASCVIVAACSSGLPELPKISKLNPFAEAPPAPLPGKRIPVLPEKDKIGGAEIAAATGPIALPPAITNASWSQPGGTPNNAPGHLALGGQVRRAWSTDIGNGSTTNGRLTASPVVSGGRVYTLDATAQVTAINGATGGAAWRLPLTPQGETGRAGYGGGLAIDGGRLIAATGFGTVTAIDPQSGKKLWEKSLGTPVRASPTAADGRIIVVSADGRVFCFNAEDGAQLWEFRGLPEASSIISNPSPALEGNLTAVPFPNGDLVVLNVGDGTVLWTESLARSRSSSFAGMSDTARPAMSGGLVFAVGHAGRMIAAKQSTGERLWSLDIPGTQTPWVAGDNVFVVDTSGKLLALDRANGSLKWTTKLPCSGSSLTRAIWSGSTPRPAGSRKSSASASQRISRRSWPMVAFTC